MVQKCKTGYKLKGKKCVRVKNSDFFRGNLFRPTDTLNKTFLWLAIVGVVLSAIIGIYAVFGGLEETLAKVLWSTMILGGSSIIALFISNINNRVVRGVGIGSVLTIGLLWLGIVWEIFEYSVSDEVAFTTLIIGLATIIGLASWVNKNNLIKIAGLVTTGISALLSLGVVWDVLNGSDNMFRFIFSTAVIAFALAHTSVLSLKGSKDPLVRGVFFFTLAMIATVTGMLIYLIINIETIQFSDTFIRFLVAFSILDVAGTIITPILRKVKG